MSELLKGRALDVYDRLSTEDAADYDKLKDTLLKNFDMTERGFRKKFCYYRPERSETFIQFSSRLCSYLNKWLTMAKVEKSFEAVCDFMARDQFLEACIRELYVIWSRKRLRILMRWLRKQICSLKRVGACLVAWIKSNEIIIRSQRKAKVSRAESLKLNVAFAENGVKPLGVIRILIGNKRIVRKSLAEVAEIAEVREVLLVWA